MDIGSYTLHAANTYENFFTELHWTGTVGEEEHPISKEKISVNPNPASGHVSISVPENIKVMNFKIIDIKGNTLISRNYFPSGNNFTEDISRFPSGIYFIHLQTENNVFTKKLIIRQ